MVITLFKIYALKFKNNFLRKAVDRLFIFLFFNFFLRIKWCEQSVHFTKILQYNSIK